MEDDDVAEDEVEDDDVEDDDVKGEEHDDDDVEEGGRSQDCDPQFVQACAVEMHMDM